jgi:Uma2 family endonuclease
MTALTRKRMSANEFLAWAAQRPEGERYELVAGEVIAMAPERVSHVRVKAFVWLALREALNARGLHCEALADGASLRIDDDTVYEPDALVRCGPPLDEDAIEVTEPTVVVEVVSPGTQSRDSGVKLADYFRVASIRHYLIVKCETRTVIHHRKDGDRIETRIVHGGALVIDPPGITVEVERFFEA